MKISEYSLDPRNAHVVRYLQSRPLQIGTTGFVSSVAMFLENNGYLSKAQRESLEGIMKRTNWKDPGPVPLSIDDRSPVVTVYVPGGGWPHDDFHAEMRERYTPEKGFKAVHFRHDPVYKCLLDPANIQNGTPNRLLTSCGIYHLTGTGWAFPGLKPKHPESADVLNEIVSPQLSTPDSDYRFRNVKVSGKNGSGWWVFGERQSRDSSKCA